MKYVNMFRTVYTVLLCIIITVLGIDAEDKLQVQVYYETKCPDSIRFFKDQLIPSMIRSGRLAFTDLQLIPFGKAIVYKDGSTKQLEARCQHGEAECLDNALHACILETTEFNTALNAIACLMRSYTRQLDRCSEEYELKLDPVNDCLENRTTAEILEKYGKLTEKIDLTYVPSVAVNGEFDYNQQGKLLYRFDQTFCKEYKSKFGTRLENCK